eukprot:PhM_4_TR18028/c2_g3_i5/m.32362
MHTLALEGVHPKTRTQHVRLLQAIKDFPDNYRQVSLTRALLAHLEKLRLERRWSWATMRQQSDAAAGALRRIGEYTHNALRCVMLSMDEEWRDAMKTVRHMAETHRTRNLRAMSASEMRQSVLRAAHNTALQVFLILCWACAGRSGDVLQLKRSQVQLEDNANGYTIVS